MNRETLPLIRIVMIVICFMYFHMGMSQKAPTTWQEKIEAAKTKGFINIGDSIQLKLVGYTYKGVIQSEAKKSEIVDMIFSAEAPIICNYPPIITMDTVVIDSICQITKKQSPVFKIISIFEMRERLKSSGADDPTIQIREKLREFIKKDYEYLEMEWNYNGKKINSICIVSNPEGGIVYDNIASNIVSTVSTTTMSTVNHNKIEKE